MSLRYDPKYSKAYGRLGIAYSKLNKFELAVDAYKKALELEPNNQDYLNNLNVAKQQMEDANQTATNASNTNTAASSSGQRAGGGFQLPPNLMEPGIQNLVQQVFSDPNQLNAVFNTFQQMTGGAGGAGPDGQPGANTDPMAGLAGLLGGAGGLNIQSLMGQLAGAMSGAGAPGANGNPGPPTGGSPPTNP